MFHLHKWKDISSEGKKGRKRRCVRCGRKDVKAWFYIRIPQIDIAKFTHSITTTIHWSKKIKLFRYWKDAGVYDYRGLKKNYDRDGNYVCGSCGQTGYAHSVEGNKPFCRNCGSDNLVPA